MEIYLSVFITDFQHIVASMQDLSRTYQESPSLDSAVASWCHDWVLQLSHRMSWDVIWNLGHQVTLEWCSNKKQHTPGILIGLSPPKCLLMPHVSLQHNNVIIWGRCHHPCFTEGLCSSSAGLSVSWPCTPGPVHALLLCLGVLFSQLLWQDSFLIQSTVQSTATFSDHAGSVMEFRVHVDTPAFTFFDIALQQSVQHTSFRNLCGLFIVGIWSPPISR